MDRIPRWNIVHHLEKRSLLIAINCMAGLAILFFGYDQGVMAGVNNSSDYISLMGFGHAEADGTPIIDDPLLQGGITSVYYVGTLVGALFGGWFGDRYGRIKAIAVGALWGVFGACLQGSAQNHTWMIFARLINGFGTGILNAIVPVYATETAEHTSRGQFVAIEFTLNIFGVVLAYWIEFGTSKYMGGTTAFTWRFPILFQVILLLALLLICFAFPESPRYLTKVGRGDEARYILGRLRGEDSDKAEGEYQDICNVVKMEKQSAQAQSYWKMLFGVGSGKLHTGRRVQLVIWLQIIQEWVGIAAVTLYSPTIFRLAGIPNEQVGWITGINQITYCLSTLICVFTLDRIGRRWTLYWGAVGQGITMCLAGGLSRLAEISEGDLKTHAGGAAVAMIFLFTCIFGATWLTVPWLYPAEIFPLEVRAKGNAWGVIGWSIGNGWTILLCPIMFNNIKYYSLFIFAACNALAIPIVWALYPESNQRTLEEMNLLFAADSPWNWEAEKNYAQMVEENPGLVRAARRGDSVVSTSGADINGSGKFSSTDRAKNEHAEKDLTEKEYGS